jgi:HEAT repeat protein
MTSRLFGLPGALVVLLLVLSPAGAAEVDPDLEEAQRLLRDAGIKADGPSLVAFFRERTLSPADRDRLVRLVVELGDDDFDVRQRASRALSAAGITAVPFLRAALRSPPDLEVFHRARACLEVVDTPSHRLVAAAAARVLAEKRPKEAAAALLAYLPSNSEEEEVGEAVLQALAVLGPGEPATLAALTDSDPARRAAAAFVLGKLAPGRRGQVRRLLKEPDLRIRFQAARGLMLGGDREAVPALLALTGEKDAETVWRAEELLDLIAGDNGPRTTAGSETAQRLQRRQAWERWWKDNGERIDLGRIDWRAGLLGLTVVCDCNVGGVNKVGRVWACGRDGKIRWQIDGVANPADVQMLPGGRILVAECYGGNKVTERDRTGKVLWQHELTDSAVNCQRLPGGNTFIATYTELLEVTPANKVVYSLKKTFRTTCAMKLRNGNILAASGDGRLVELDTTGKEIRSVTVGNLASWAGIEVLPGGRLLVAQYSANKVVEIDSAGKELWSVTLTTPAWATRLRNGNTLACSPDGHFVAEYDSSGKEVWKREAFGRPFRVRRY